jgi:hypothetical protein
MRWVAWTRRLFGSRTEFFEYLVFVSVNVAGFLHAAWMWIVIGAMVLLLLDWPRWRELFAKAGTIDAEYLKRGRLAWERRVYEYVLRMFGTAYHLPLVLAGKMGFDALYLAAVFFLGHVTAWVWGAR